MANDDDQIDEEYEADTANLQEIFEEIDQDGDGDLFPEELKTYL